jgi:hypothetical protein
VGEDHGSFRGHAHAAGIKEGLAILIAVDLERSIANLGYPVGCGVAPNPETCLRAAERIVDRVKDRALELLAECANEDPNPKDQPQ